MARSEERAQRRSGLRCMVERPRCLVNDILAQLDNTGAWQVSRSDDMVL